MKKCAMIGCGGIGSYHLEHLMTFKDIELAGFCDIIPERAEAFAHKAGGRAYTDFHTMYDAVAPDMVFICVPPYAHGEIEFETIKRGIHMFVEKPVTLDLALAKEISRQVLEKGLITAVGFQCRYSNLIAPTKDFIAKHQIVYVEGARMGGIPDTPWWADKKLSGGQIVEQTVHQFDVMRYLMGEPTEVYTMGARGFVKRDHYDTDDLSNTAIRFASGALGNMATGCYATAGAAMDSKLTFSAKDARLDHYIITRVNIYGDAAVKGDYGLVVKGDGTLAAGADVVTLRDDGTAGITCDRTFVDAVLTGDAANIRSPYADAVKTLAFVLACNQSMEGNQPVKVPQ